MEIQEGVMIGVCMLGFMGLLLIVEYSQGNVSSLNVSTTKSPTTTSSKQAKDAADLKAIKDLPDKGAAEVEHQSSLTIFFIILVVGQCNFTIFSQSVRVCD